MKSNRPRLKIPFSTLEKTGEACSLSAMGLSAIVIGTQWTSMPEAIPIHFSFAGAIDGMGPKSSLFLLLGIMTSIYLLLTFLSQFPHLFNYPVTITLDNARSKYQLARSLIQLLKAETMLFMAGLTWVITEASFGRTSAYIYHALIGYLVVSGGTTLVYTLRLFKSSNQSKDTMP